MQNCAIASVVNIEWKEAMRMSNAAEEDEKEDDSKDLPPQINNVCNSRRPQLLIISNSNK